MTVQIEYSIERNEEEHEALKDKDTMMEERDLEEYKNHDMTKPQRAVDTPWEMNTILGMK